MRNYLRQSIFVGVVFSLLGTSQLGLASCDELYRQAIRVDKKAMTVGLASGQFLKLLGIKIRKNQYATVLALLQEAKMGGGESVNHLYESTGRKLGIDKSQLVEWLKEQNRTEAFCQDGRENYYRLAQIKTVLKESF